MGARQLTKRELEQHKMHTPHSDFDYYCIAHDENYSPKYLKGETCHDFYDGYCNDACNRCPKRCPVPFCNTKDDPYFKEYWE